MGYAPQMILVENYNNPMTEHSRAVVLEDRRLRTFNDANVVISSRTFIYKC